MRRSLIALVVGLALALAAALPATASDTSEMCGSGSAFGLHHAEHAQEGMLGGDMNPGMHEGFSVCLP